MSKSLSVLIVGAGPTGLVLAHELARAEIQCRLIDQAAHRATQSRAIAIHSRTLETFELMKVVDDFLTAGQRINAVDIYGSGGLIAHNGFETRLPRVIRLSSAYRRTHRPPVLFCCRLGRPAHSEFNSLQRVRGRH